MRQLARFSTALAVTLIIFSGGLTPAMAACKKMGFLVNDYGKEGPTKDAQLLLDKHIAAWADEQGINEYSVGKKTVKCELFLDVILFDEHTCTASATVCWGGSKQPKARLAKGKKKSKSKQAKAKDVSKKKTTAKVDKKPAKKSAVVKTVARKTEEVKAKSADKKVETSAIVRDAPSPSSTETTGAGQKSPSVPYADNAVIRDGGDASAPSNKATVAKTTPPANSERYVAVSSERAAADRAAAAAERAAAAAERAAAAAQQAAEAAKQAAAARAAVVAPVVPDKTP